MGCSCVLWILDRTHTKSSILGGVQVDKNQILELVIETLGSNLDTSEACDFNADTLQKVIKWNSVNYGMSPIQRYLDTVNGLGHNVPDWLIQDRDPEPELEPEKTPKFNGLKPFNLGNRNPKKKNKKKNGRDKHL